MKKKTLAIILACLFMLLPVFASCADNSEDSGKKKGSKEEIGDPNLTAEDWDGEVFDVLTSEDREEGQAFNIVDLVADDDSDLSDPIVSAVFERNEKIEDLFNARIERCNEQATAYNKIINDITMGGDEYDAFMMKINSALNSAIKGDLLDLNSEVEYINLQEAWWDTTTIETLKVNNRSYFALGDLNTVDDDGTWCFLFNKAIRDEYDSFPTFYDLVEEGRWTVENMKYYASRAIIEDNGGSTAENWAIESGYRYGLYFQDECATALLQSSGVTPYTVGKGGRPVANFESIEMQNAIIAIRDNMMLENAVNAKWALNINNVNYNSATIWRDIARGGFKANKALFFMCHCGSINLLRDMEADFGILPLPKLSEAQEKYGNTVQYGTATCYAICLRAPDPEFSGFMLEAMGYYSSREYSETDSLKIAYYETTLQRKAARDDESWDMLDMVFDNRIFDISCAMNAGQINSRVVEATITDKAWTTITASYGSQIKTEVDDYVSRLMNPGQQT